MQPNIYISPLSVLFGKLLNRQLYKHVPALHGEPQVLQKLSKVFIASVIVEMAGAGTWERDHEEECGREAAWLCSSVFK